MALGESSTRTRNGYLDIISPIRKDRSSDKENDVPVLSLLQFSKAPFVTFGCVRLGSSRSAFLRVDNPTEDDVAQVRVEKIPSSKGFSVDHSSFTIQPGSHFILTITWTPSEEGGVRELVIFNANGVLRHQAVVLGRAEAPKKKKKSLWDSIKNKRAGDQSVTPRGQKTGTTLKIAANKTFQVPRNQQYMRGKPRSPLSLLNEGKTVRARSLSKYSPIEDNSGQSAQPRASKPARRRKSPVLSDQDNVENNSPVVLLVPVANPMEPTNSSAEPHELVSTPEHRVITRVLNRTLSPIGTPESFKNLMPRIRSLESPLDAVATESELVSPQTQILSVRDALAIIDSDLIHLNASPPNANSSYSDSLESLSGSYGGGSENDALTSLPDSPVESESSKPRLTFFVNKKPGTTSQVVDPEIQVGDNLRVKKCSFTSATVTKVKAPVATDERIVKKSRRKLLERTLELTDDCGHCESSPATPDLPVIECDSSRTEESPSPLRENRRPLWKSEFSGMTSAYDGLPAPATFQVTCSPTMAPGPIAFPVSSSVLSVPSDNTFTVTSPPSTVPSSPLPCDALKQSLITTPPHLMFAPLSVHEDLTFPIHSLTVLDMAVRNKKRKSDEFLQGEKVENVEKTERGKRRRVAAVMKEKSVQEKRSVPKRQETRTAGSVRSVRSVKTAQPVAPTQAKNLSQASHSLKSFGVRPVKTARIVAVAQSKLTFIKPAQTVIPRHPMPFAAKNMFYDERWIEKQERGFTWWINYVLTPDDFKVNTEVAKGKVNAVSLAMSSDEAFNVPKAPTKEEMSFSTYTARRRLNRLRRAACQLFTSEAMVKAIQKLEQEVEAKRLLIRKDRHLWKDIGERQKVLNWLLAYNPLWLRIGIETIFGELISLENNGDVLGLAVFILKRLLWNPDLAAQYRHAKVPNLYKDGHEEALSRFSLKKLLLLVCFLDKAKESRLIEHDPCLFCMDAEFKTSKDLLLAFSRDFLSGEGILPRHLGYLGLPVSHGQTPLDEFDFAVRNLAVDLKCGIRLVRVMELFIKDWSLSRKLRLPAISRLQKVHNMEIALQVLKDRGVDLKDEYGSAIDSRDIVDGHREKTLSLLWKIIFAFQVEVILDEEQLREEIDFLKRTWSTKQRLASLRADKGLTLSSPKVRTPYKHSSTKIALLMDWVNAVCDFYGLKAENFTVSFSDGRVLCHLIHHYHPNQLPAEAVSQCTTQTVECSHRGRVELDSSGSDSDSSFDSRQMGQDGPESPSLGYKELLENEKNNFKLINSAVTFLGGVPAMINTADMSNTIPNEKVVMSYLSFLCVRLLDLRNETRAARVIQDAWRKYRLKKDQELYQERNVAAVKIQVVVRSFLHRQKAKRHYSAAIAIQARWRGYAARNALRLKEEAQRQALRCNAATVIQAQWRMYTARRAYQHLNYSAIVVQAHWRMRRASSAYARMLWAAAVIQKYTRAWTTARRERQQYISLRTSVLQLQRNYRRRKAQRLERLNQAATVIQTAFWKWHKERTARRTAAALKIQSWYRMHTCLLRYAKLKRSALVIQAHYRGHTQRRCFQRLRLRQHSAIVIQSALRGHVVRKRLTVMRQASVVIQRWFRASVKRDIDRKNFVKARVAATAIQAAYRGHVARRLLKEQHQAATVIQTAFRKFAAQRRYLSLKTAAMAIQKWYRAMALAQKKRKEYEVLRHAALSIQAVWRGRADRKKLKKRHQSATLIQAHYRRHKAHTQYKSRKAAAIVMQRQFRAYTAGKVMRADYLRVKGAAVILQAGFRGMKVRRELRGKRQAATVIQSAVRMTRCRKRYLLLQSATIIIQSRYRALLEGKEQQREYRRLRHATMKIQAAYRGFRVREDLKQKKDAATVIQAHFRMHKVRVAYLATKCAAVVVQERYRAQRLRNEQMQRYRTMRSATVVIQAAYRGHRARLEVAEMHRAAIVIQRRFHTLKDRKRFLAIKGAAVFCQQKYRAINLVKKDLLNYLLMRSAIISIQAAYRGMVVRRQMHTERMAAITIQSHIRKYLQRAHYKKLQWAANTMQARFRANKLMREEVHALNTKKNAAVILQAAFRGMKSRQQHKQKHHAATVIQRTYRTHCEHRRYLTLKSSVITIQQRYRATLAATQQMHQYQRMRDAAVCLQAAYRGHRARLEVAVRHQAATVIQSAFRSHREQIKFQAMRLSAILIQRYYRSCILQRHERERFLEMKRSAIILQAALRGHLVRCELNNMHRAATVLQANFKRHKQQSAFRRQCWAASAIQEWFRAQKLRSIQVKNYQRVRMATTTLQAAFRGMKSRQIIKQKHHAATVIQRTYRTHCEHRRYLTLKSSVITIQQRYRATLAAKQQMHQYQRMRAAAVCLQATYRGHRARREVARCHKAATVIQSAFRSHREQIKFQAMRLSAILIQRYYRAFILQKREREQFLKTKHSAIILQAALRGHLVRRELNNMHRAATVLQRRFHTLKDRKHFLAIKGATVFCQQKYRAINLAKKDRLNYLLMRRAIISIQAAYRGMVVRRKMHTERMAAITIQSHIRKYLQRAHYKKLQWAANTMQARFRANKTMKEEVHALNTKKNAAVILQAAFRGMKSRQQHKQKHHAATVIQRTYRTHCEHRRYLTLKSSVITIQKRYRATLAAKQQMQQYQRMRDAAVCLQAAYRGHRARREVAVRHQAATVIQSAFRKHREQIKFQAMRLSAILIQRYYRACILQRHEQERFLKMKRSAIILQAALRGHVVRCELNNMHRAATVLQANFKRHKQQSAFRRQCWAASAIQEWFRAQKLRSIQVKNYQRVRMATTTLQAAFRGMKSRQRIRQKHHAATVIQRTYRTHCEHRRYLTLKSSVITIQQRYRATLAAKQQMHQYQRMRDAAVCLQAAYRGHRARREVAVRHQAATVIQSAFRSHREQIKFQAMRLSAILIQRYYRACILQRRERKQFLKTKHSAIILQAALRGHLVRCELNNMHRAATVLQRRFHTLKDRKHFLAIKGAAVFCQQKYRAINLVKNDRLNYLMMRSAIISIQAAYRGMVVRRKMHTQRMAAITIQSHIRKYLQRAHYKKLQWAASTMQARFRANKLMREEVHALNTKKNAAVILQAAFRGMKSRQQHKQKRHAATVIQRTYRTHCEHRRYLTLKSSVITIQQRYRATLAAKQQMQQYQRMRAAAVCLQAAYRGHRARREVVVRHQAATVIQSAFRKHREQIKFQAMRLSAMLIQRYYRSCILQRRERERFLKMKRSAIILQAALRGHQARREIARQNQAATLIQSCWRCSVQRRTFKRQREATVVLQRKVRAVWLARTERDNYNRMRSAAITLQFYCRRWITRRQVQEAGEAQKRLRFAAAAFHHLSAIRIQRSLRAHWALQSAKKQIHSVIAVQRWVRARQERTRFLAKRRKVVIAQRAVRRWLAHRRHAAAVIQRAAKTFLLLKRQRRLQSGIIKAQALWRGHRSRMLHDNPKVVKVRHCLQRVSTGVREEDKLRNKTSIALEYLLKYKDFAHILEALQNLETATRLSPECCERLVESGATVNIFILIRSCNRSIPCMEIIAHSIQILLNLTKYHKTTEAVYAVENSVETLLDLLQRYREKAGDKVADKGGSIFTKACFLLALLLQDRQRAQEVKTLPKALDRISSIYRLTARKFKMDAERTLVRNKMNASINGSFLQATPRKSRPVPKFGPDWVLGKNKLKDIVDPIRAIAMVAEAFSIVL